MIVRTVRNWLRLCCTVTVGDSGARAIIKVGKEGRPNWGGDRVAHVGRVCTIWPTRAPRKWLLPASRYVDLVELCANEDVPGRASVPRSRLRCSSAPLFPRRSVNLKL